MAETATLTLTDFLLARIAEDEAAASELRDQYPHSGGPTHLSGNWDIVKVTTGYDRVLAECEAKRRIVESHGAAILAESECEPWDNETGWVVDARLAETTAAMHALATVYADHPDYRDEWRVG